MYGIDDPLTCLLKDPPSKHSYKEYILTKITSFHERELRLSAEANSRMQYFNVTLGNLRARAHPAVSNMLTSEEVRQSRPIIKMLTGDFFTYELKSKQTGGSDHCRCCNKNDSNYIPNPETISHLLTICSAFQDIREKILQEMIHICERIQYLDTLYIFQDKEVLCQFILDPASMNLKSRVNINDPLLPDLYRKSRNLCYSIADQRLTILKEKRSC